MWLTCKQMLIVNDLFYKRSSLWWFLYEHISGLSPALLNHLHTGNWRWEYYSTLGLTTLCVRHIGIFRLAVHLTATAHLHAGQFRIAQLRANKGGQISLPNRREGGFFLLSCYSCLRRTSQLTLTAAFLVFLFWIAGHWFKQSYDASPLLGAK